MCGHGGARVSERSFRQPTVLEISDLTLTEWYNPSYTSFMKTAISIPDALFQSAEETTERLGISRSELYRRALEHYLAQHDDEVATAKLNEVYDAAPATLDPVLARLQWASLPREEW